MVRDAAITTWLNTASAPISGDLDGTGLRPGSIVGAEGLIACITNPRADRTALERALGELAAAEARFAQLQHSKKARQSLAASYATAFKDKLDIRLGHESSTLDYLGKRLTAERADAGRFSTLRDAGSASPAAAEAAAARVAALEGERVMLESSLARTRLRRESAGRGLYLLDDGSPSSWDAHLDLVRAEQEFVAAQAELAATRAVAEAARAVYDRQHTVALTAPSGTQIWNRLAAPGAAVLAGAPVVTWIDPGVLLVDVPLSDVEAGLLRPGARAEVVFEGERRMRIGTVILTRGSAATLDTRELAAVAKGRRAGVGQALVQLEPSDEDRAHSPVGRAAYVDFPDVGVFSIIRARLRL